MIRFPLVRHFGLRQKIVIKLVPNSNFLYIFLCDLLPMYRKPALGFACSQNGVNLNFIMWNISQLLNFSTILMWNSYLIYSPPPPKLVDGRNTRYFRRYVHKSFFTFFWIKESYPEDLECILVTRSTLYYRNLSIKTLYNTFCNHKKQCN